MTFKIFCNFKCNIILISFHNYFPNHNYWFTILKKTQRQLLMIPILLCVYIFFSYYYTAYSKHESNFQVTQSTDALQESSSLAGEKQTHNSFSKEVMK